MINDSNRGFTLIEVVIATTILGMLLLIILSAMRLGIKSWEKGDAIVDEIGTLRLVASRLSSEIGSMYPYIQKDEEGETFLFVGNDDEVGFVTTDESGNIGMPRGGTRWVHYSVTDSVLTVREKIIPSQDIMEDSGGQLIELDTSVESIDFEYLGDGGWQGEWDADSEKDIPRGIKVTLSFKGEDVPFVMTMPIRALSGIKKLLPES
ncbi:MAG: type II secretion system protein GspJ [Thermodesulfobacteriota bacterium]